MLFQRMNDVLNVVEYTCHLKFLVAKVNVTTLASVIAFYLFSMIMFGFYSFSLFTLENRLSLLWLPTCVLRMRIWCNTRYARPDDTILTFCQNSNVT